MTSTCNNNALQLLPHSPQAQMTMTPNALRSITSSTRQVTSPSKQRTPARNSSPIKQRRLSSPRKSPKKVLFQTAEPVSFTPQRTKQPPRAWERRAATPFVPRDEKQKIWKRVPLGELGIDANRPVGISRRDQEGSKDYTRVVKKLKTGHNSGETDDKENYAIDTKVINQEDALKRSKSRGGDFVSMRMEEDEMLGSPKKKFRQLSQDRPLQESASAVFGSDGSADEYKQNEEDSEIDGNMKIPDSSSSPSAESEDHIDEQTNLSEIDTTVDRSNTALSEGMETEETEETTTYTQEQGAKHAVEDVTPSISKETAETDTNALIDLANADEVANDKSITNQEKDYIEEPQSSSPPTILAENVLVDELELAESQNSQQNTQAQDECSAANSVDEEIQDRHVSKTVSKRVSDDETAFLQSFLSRTKARKAARETEINTTPSSEQPTQQDVLDTANTHDIEPPKELVAPTTFDSLADYTEEVPASPLRRSKRAVVTGLTRVPSLPSAIQLKRASGNEFIFTANKASSTANVAMLTRTNTKQNKGSALNVRARLDEMTTGTNDTIAYEPNEWIFDNTEIKRKRSKNDEGRKAKKVLKWNDDNLVSYQEFKTDDPFDEDTGNSSQDNVLSTAKDESGANYIAKIKLTMNMPSSKTTKGKGRNSTQEGDRDRTGSDSSQSRVRRVRRGVAGSVNGTPGPKTRSKKIINEDDDDEEEVKVDETLQESAAATVALNELSDQTSKSTTATAPTTTRRSRIAVPSTRNVRVMTSRSSESTKNEGNSDPLGKRRLRVRD